ALAAPLRSTGDGGRGGRRRGHGLPPLRYPVGQGTGLVQAHDQAVRVLRAGGVHEPATERGGLGRGEHHAAQDVRRGGSARSAAAVPGRCRRSSSSVAGARVTGAAAACRSLSGGCSSRATRGTAVFFRGGLLRRGLLSG